MSLDRKSVTKKAVNKFRLEKPGRWREISQKSFSKWRKEKGAAWARIYYQANKQKVLSRVKVRQALKRGALKKKKCHCGEIDVEAHHTDYSKPLQVQWLCKRHHLEITLKCRKLTQK